MPKFENFGQLGEGAMNTYGTFSDSDKVSALKMKVSEFDRTQRQRKFDLFSEGIKMQVYDGSIDEISGYNRLLDKAKELGIDELDIAKLKSKQAQLKKSAYDKQQNIEELTEAEKKKIIEVQMENQIEQTGSVDLNEFYEIYADDKDFTRQELYTLSNQAKTRMGVEDDNLFP